MSRKNVYPDLVAAWKEGITNRELAKAAHVDVSTVARHKEELEKAGYHIVLAERPKKNRNYPGGLTNIEWLVKHWRPGMTQAELAAVAFVSLRAVSHHHVELAAAGCTFAPDGVLKQREENFKTARAAIASGASLADLRCVYKIAPSWVYKHREELEKLIEERNHAER
jgi:DNA-binding Lrp family transcriptional regulator